MIAQAVILAGGSGTRLGALTRHVPKPALPVAGRPFLLWLLDELRRQGVAESLVLAGVHGEQIADLLRDRSDARVLIEPEPLGTGGALRFAASKLEERFYFLNGDSLFDINLLDLAAHAEDADGCLALRVVPDASRFGEVVLEGTTVTVFRERPLQPGPALINGGVAVLTRRVAQTIPEGGVSIEREVYPRLAAAGRLRGRAYDRPFIDIGVPEELARAQDLVADVLTRRAVVFTRGALIKEGPGGGAWRDGAGEAIKAVNDAGLLALLRDDGRGSVGQSGLAPGLAAVGAHIDAVFGDAPPRSLGSLPIAAVATLDASEAGAFGDDLPLRTRAAIDLLAKRGEGG